MRTFSPILAAALLAAAPSVVAIGFAQAQTCTCPPRAADAGSGSGSGYSQARIISDEAPPPLPEYDQPPLPGPGYMWTPGYWAWNNDDYYFVPGTWVEPPHPGVLWTPGYWAFNDGGYRFHRGYWAPHVGFYGGVAYGFGYFGAGFEGGRWQGDHFFYNRTVNNFGSVHIVNVYEHPAPRIVERISFNGGPDGVKARPTPEQIAAEKEKHIPATVEQRRNMRAASHNEAAFVTNNRGKPPVAATQKPGEFKGAAVAPAKAAGGPIKARTLDEETPRGAEGEKGKAEAGKPELKGEKPELKGDKPQLRGEKPEAKPDAQKPEPKAEKSEAKPDKREAKPEKSEAKPDKHEARPEKHEAKPEAHKPEPKAEPRAEKPRPEAERPKPAAEPQHAKPEHAKPEHERPEHAKPEHGKPEHDKP
jgi:hypothetical protein